VLQISSFLKTLKTATLGKAAANAEMGLAGSDAALNRSWKLDQAQADFLATQTSAQATVAATALEDSSKGAGSAAAPAGPATPGGSSAQTGAAPERADKIPMGSSWDTQGTTARVSASEGISGLEKLGMDSATINAALPADLTTGATMDEVQAAGRELVKSFDSRVVPAINALNKGGAGKDGTAAVGVTPLVERQVEIIRGMSEGQYSPVVADKLLRQDTGHTLAEAMARLSGTVDFIQKIR
jgi:hypothetical protein